jgi:methylated-DNA-[protein]-cysteine S-methyltransferase
MINIQYYKSPAGELVIGDYQGRLCLCDWRYRRMRSTIDSRISKILGCGFQVNSTPLIEDAIVQLTEYFDGSRRRFDIPLLMAGSDFQKEVWNKLIEVEYGTTSTYSRLADSMGRPTAVRAVAAANGANAISIIVPCHRIIGSDGSLVGYAGGLDAKKRLLAIENRSRQLSVF